MTTGVSTASLFMREMNEDALTVLDGLGVKSTEVFLTTFSEYSEEFARLLLSRRGGLNINSVHLLNTEFEPQLFSAHPRARKDAYSLLRGAMRSAHIFGAKAYTLHGITRLKKNSAPADCGKLAADVEEIQSVCRAEGARLGITFDEPQRAPTPGQAAAVYLPDGRLAAGGVIARGAGT